MLSLLPVCYGFESNISEHSHCCGTPNVLKRQILVTVNSLFRSFKIKLRNELNVLVLYILILIKRNVSLRIVRIDTEQGVRFSYLSFFLIISYHTSLVTDATEGIQGMRVNLGNVDAIKSANCRYIRTLDLIKTFLQTLFC